LRAASGRVSYHRRMAGGEQPTDPPPSAPLLRASDSEREHTATLLRDHAAAGRLTPEELDERLDAAYAARTVGELEALAHDLPVVADRAPDPGPERSAEHEAARRRLVHVIGQSALICAAATAIWLATGAGDFWPKWVLVAMTIRVAFRAWGELGPAGRGERGHRRAEARLGRGGSGGSGGTRPQ